MYRSAEEAPRCGKAQAPASPGGPGTILSELEFIKGSVVLQTQ